MFKSKKRIQLEKEIREASELCDMLRLKMPVGSTIRYLGKAMVVVAICEPFICDRLILGPVVDLEYADKEGRVRRHGINGVVASVIDC